MFRFTLAAGLVFSGLMLASAAPASAQTRQAPASQLFSPAPVPSARSFDEGPHTLFTFHGINAAVDAPVQAPGDSNVAYRTFEGQSATGGDTIVSQMTGMPRD